MKIHACPECASRSLRPPSVADGVYAGGGERLMTVCDRCGARGQPLVFDGKESYRAFRDGRRGAAAPRPRGPSTLGDHLDRLMARDTVARLVGASFALGGGIVAVGLVLLAAGSPAWLGAVGLGPDVALAALALCATVAYLFLRPAGPRLSPRRDGVRRRVSYPWWVPPLALAFGTWTLVSGVWNHVAASLAGATPVHAAVGLLSLASGLLLWSALLLWGLGAWRDQKALRKVPRHLRP